VLASLARDLWHVLCDSSEELGRRQRAVISVLGSEGDATLRIERLDAIVRDADTMGVSAQIRVHLLGAGKRFLGIHEPPRAMEFVAHARECVRRVGW